MDLEIVRSSLAADRVRRRTADRVNDRIDCHTQTMLQEVGDDPDEIVRRLAELDDEWDIDRALMANFAVIGTMVHELERAHPAFRMLLRAQLGFMMMHALVGWCPPVFVFRRLGFRTQKEIHAERAVLRDRLERVDARAF